jgi:hypothetical protein
LTVGTGVIVAGFGLRSWLVGVVGLIAVTVGHWRYHRRDRAPRRAITRGIAEPMTPISTVRGDMQRLVAAGVQLVEVLP